MVGLYLSETTRPIPITFDAYHYPDFPILRCENGRNRNTMTPTFDILHFTLHFTLQYVKKALMKISEQNFGFQAPIYRICQPH